MKKGFIALLAISASTNSLAASQQMVWGKTNQALPQIKQVSPFTKKGFAQSIPHQATSDYQLKLIETKSKDNHARYQVTYKGLPVWGHELVFHKQNDNVSSKVTGINVSGIEQDVENINGQLSPEDAAEQVLSTVKTPVKYQQIKKIIFIDKNQSAHLAYHLSFYTSSNEKPISSPNYIINANTGETLQSWDAVRTEKLGQGLGGNAFDLPYRPGMFQYGSALPGLQMLGKFDVQVSEGKCHVENDHFRVSSMENYPLGYDAFPISVFDEAAYEIEVFSYPCSPNSRYVNYADGTSGPVNYSFSPINDAMYFAQKTVDMYKELYGVEKPLGDDLPLRVFTHVGAMDNAFSIPTIKKGEIILAHQQITIGDGLFFLTAPAQTVVAHELSHNFTSLNSDLMYMGQMGGINEAFSDMAAIAMQDYIRKDHPWYWDGEDWSLGREAVIGGEPLRYMDRPSKDGFSIDHADDYNDNIDVHHSSGVFNRAFYLLANKPGWTVQSAFKVMVDANQRYWSPLAYFDFAACGVIQAAEDNFLNPNAVIEAFDEVGVHCPIKIVS